MRYHQHHHRHPQQGVPEYPSGRVNREFFGSKVWERSENGSTSGAESDLPYVKKEKESVKLIESALRKNPYLKHVVRDRRAMRAVIGAMRLRIVPAKSVIIEERTMGDEMYVCDHGILEITINGQYVKQVYPGELFGELTVIYGTPRKATVRALTECSLWVMQRSLYFRIQSKYFAFRREDYVRFFQGIPVFQSLNGECLRNIQRLMRIEGYPPKSTIIRQGDRGSEFFVITGGSVLVSVISSDGREKLIEKLGQGDYFGEGALLENKQRAATVTAEPPGVECIILDRQIFSQYLRDLEQIRRAVKERRAMTTEVLENDIEYSFVKLDDLEVKGIISYCSLGNNYTVGRVDLVQYKANLSLVFAQKTIRKADIVSCGLRENVLAEREILLSCRSPFIVRLYKTFRDRKYLYFLQEACLGGTLRRLLDERKYFDDNMTRFIAACVIEAFEYLHCRRIVYQNLKLENLLLNFRGYVKLVDFSFAQIIRPQSINSRLNDPADEFQVFYTDWKSLGYLIFEMLAGRPLYNEDTDDDGSSSSGSKAIPFPNHVTNSAKLITRKLLRQKFKQEEDSHMLDTNEIKRHHWFDSFSWVDLQNETLKPVYIPKLQSHTDLSNFDACKKDKEIPPDVNVSWDTVFG